MKLFSTSSDPVLLGSLLLAGYDVKYFPSSEKMPLDAHPEAVVLDGDLSDKEILTVEAKYLDLSVLLVRTDSALSQKGKVKILPQNTTATVLIQTLKNTEKGEEGTSIKKILIIEDNTAINEMYRTAFAQAGCKVETAFDGLEGITKAGAMKPDIILLDLMMPNMDGFEMLTALKRRL